MQPLTLHPDRLFPRDPLTRDIARQLYSQVANLPIVSPHGHTDPRWFSKNQPFVDATDLLLRPDHYVLRMLYSQGISLEALGIAPKDGASETADSRTAWRTFARHYHLFRGTPSRMWLDWVFSAAFGLKVRLDATTADEYFDTINARLAEPACRPRALFDRFNIEVLATTESPIDTLEHHAEIRASGWRGRVITAFRPDPVVDPEFEGFIDNLRTLSELTREDCFSYKGYLAALRKGQDRQR